MGRKTRLVVETKKDTFFIIYPPSDTKAKKCREDVYGNATPQHLLQHVSMFLNACSPRSHFLVNFRPGLKPFVKIPL